MEHDGLWIYDVARSRLDSIHWNYGDYSTIEAGQSDLFSVQHHARDARQVVITVHSFARPQDVVASVILDRTGALFNGDAGVWSQVARTYVGYLETQHSTTYKLVRIEVSGDQGSATAHELDWFDSSFDHGWQAPSRAVEIPQSLANRDDPADTVIVTVGRCSDLFFHAISESRLVRKVRLPGHLGNPRLAFLPARLEMWATDYDILARVDTRTWSILASRQLQAPNESLGQFVGDPALTANGRVCVVPRPFSGDVALVRTNDFEIERYVSTGMQPLEAVMTTGGALVARDWKSGQLLVA